MGGRLLGLCLLMLALAGCVPPEPVVYTPTPAPTATVTPEPSATIIWFPPTATYTAFPTQAITPTVDLRPQLGEVLLEDRFTRELWQTGRTGQGSIAYGEGELTLAVSAKGGTLQSFLPDRQFNDFYLEIAVQPSLCRSGDVYGLLLRATTPGDYYRLLVNCDGNLRLERLKNSRVLPLQDWTPSGHIPPGGLLETRLGVWALGEELRVYINDQELFALADPVWTGGQVGVFARSAGDTPLTVNFSDLVIYSLEGGQTAERTPTPAAP